MFFTNSNHGLLGSYFFSQSKPPVEINQLQNSHWRIQISVPYNQRRSAAPRAVLCFISLLLSGLSDQVLSDRFLWEILVIAIIHRSSNGFAEREKCFRKIARYMI